MTGSSHSVMAYKSESMPPSELDKSFPGGPEGFQRMHWKRLIYGEYGATLSRNDSQSSSGSTSIDEVKAQNIAHGDEDIPTLDSFFAGLQDMAELHYENQLHDQVTLIPNSEYICLCDVTVLQYFVFFAPS